MIDLFASGFTFKIDAEGNKLKKTNMGVVLSYFILLLSGVYFGYLAYAFSYKINPPTITEETILQEDTFKYDFSYSPSHVQIYVADESVNLDEYFTLWVIINNEDGHQPSLMNKCSDLFPDETKYHDNDYCLDKEKAHLKSNKKDHTIFQDMFIIVGRCDETLGQDGIELDIGDDQYFNCKSMNEIDELLHHHETVIFLTNIFYELNHNNGELEEKDVIQEIWLDKDLIQHSHITIKIAESDLDTHPLWTSHDTFDYAFDYRMTQYFYTSDFATSKFTEKVMQDAFMITQLVLDTNLTKYTIVYEKLSDMLAKFFSLFNTIMIIGIIGAMTSEAKLLECTMDTYLRNYYKETAQILNRNNKADDAQKLISKMKKIQPETDIEEGEENQQNQNKKTQKTLPDISVNNDILRISNFKSLVLNNMAKVIRKKQKKEKKKKDAVKKSLSRSLQHKKSIEQIKKPEEDEQQNEDDEMSELTEPKDIDRQKLYLRMFPLTQSALEFRTLYKEILSLKTQMQLVLSEDQYAASYYMSRRICFSQELDTKNHVEKQDLVEGSEKYRREKVLQFKERYLKQKDSGNNDESIDKRIYDCLLQEVLDLERQKQFEKRDEFQQIVDENDENQKIKQTLRDSGDLTHDGNKQSDVQFKKQMVEEVNNIYDELCENPSKKKLKK